MIVTAVVVGVIVAAIAFAGVITIAVKGWREREVRQRDG